MFLVPDSIVICDNALGMCNQLVYAELDTADWIVIFDSCSLTEPNMLTAKNYSDKIVCFRIYVMHFLNFI